VQGGTKVIAKQISHVIFITAFVIKVEFSILPCVNVVGTYMLNLYIFKGKRRTRNYIKRCKKGETIAMQSKA
jgi:hypothetical protein